MALHRKQNALIMGRKTYYSIPPQARPLKNRINIILSNQLSASALPEGVHIVGSYEDALRLVDAQLRNQVEKIFVIGGSSVYETAMKRGCHRLYVTRILADFDCDTFMPEFDMNTYKKISLPDVPTSVQTENGIDFMYEVYQSD